MIEPVVQRQVEPLGPVRLDLEILLNPRGDLHGWSETIIRLPSARR